MATTIQSPGNILHTLGGARISTRDTLGTTWTEQPALELLELRMTVAPDIDEAKIRLRYGEWNFGVRTPQDLLRFYVKVELLDGNGDVLAPAPDPEADPEDPPPDPYESATWYGVIEIDQHDVFGSTETPTGDQVLVAFGLLRLLENTIIRSSKIKGPGAPVLTIPRGLAFNLDERGQYSQVGNRFAIEDGPKPGFIFDDDLTSSRPWTASQAIQYLINYHLPQTHSDVDIAAGNWEITGATDALDWYTVQVATDRRNVKDVLDELIDRRRLVGYFLRGSEAIVEGQEEEEDPETEFKIELRIFSFTDATISLPGGKTLLANDVQYDLNFENALDILTAELIGNASQIADVVIAEGEPITSTFTIFKGYDLNVGSLSTGWTSTEQAFYHAGSDLDDTDEALNTLARGRDELKDVYSKFVMSDVWDLSVPKGIDDILTNYYVVVAFETLVDMIVPDDIAEWFELGSPKDPEAGDIAYRLKRFQRFLPLLDESEREYRDPLLLFRSDPISIGDTWELAEQLNQNSDADGDALARGFSCSVEMLETELGIRVEVGRAGGQQLIARAEWAAAAPAATPSELDPDNTENNAVDYEHMICTVAMEWDERVSATEENILLAGGLQKRTKIIKVPHARLDVLIPGTVTDVNADGELVTSENGEIIRDDRERLQQIAKAAAAWYSKVRLAARLTFKQVTPAGIDLGGLVTSIGSDVFSRDVNSPVTAMHFRLDQEFTTTIETSYAELDFS